MRLSRRSSRRIALGGLAHTKAPRIKQILDAISQGAGEPDLSELASMTDAEAEAYLTGMPGIGPKTAACVLLFALRAPRDARRHPRASGRASARHP